MSETPHLKLEFGKVYHIYNCGIDGCNIFIDDNDYDKFLSKYATYIEPIADTYAWSLLGNHFHLVVKIKNEIDIETMENLKLFELSKEPHTLGKKPNPTHQFSHLFNAYAQYFNHKYKRHGSLFETPFNRKLIDNLAYFKNSLIYVHQNPLKHRFVERLSDYRYTSYNTILSDKVTYLKREKVLSLFQNKADFELSHVELVTLDEMFD